MAALEDPGADDFPDPVPEAGCVPDWCWAEIAGALRLSGTAAQARLDLARDLRARLTHTAERLRRGDLTEHKAHLIAKAVRSFDDRIAAVIETAVLPDAPSQTPGELQRALARAVIEADPDGAAERATEASAGGA